MQPLHKAVFGATITCMLLVAALLTIASCMKKEIESTRFGVIESLPLNSGSTELFIIKDQLTKKQYLLCANCTLTEYKEKK